MRLLNLTNCWSGLIIPLLLSNFYYMGGSVAPKWLQLSLFPNVPPTLKFSYHMNNRTILENSIPPIEIRKYLVWKSPTPQTTEPPTRYQNGSISRDYRPLSKILGASGWTKRSKANHNEWIGNWQGPKSERIISKPYQKINKMPNMAELDNKAKMWKHLKKGINKFGKAHFDFVPETYLFPEDVDQLKEVLNPTNMSTNELWIIKPSNGTKSRGVRIIQNLTQLPNSGGSWVVQKFLANPYLINGQRIQVRAYVLTTSFDPIRIYMFDDWVSRFGPRNYSDSNNANTTWCLVDAYECEALLNYKISKVNPFGNYMGNTWNKSRLLQHMGCIDGINVTAVEDKLNDAIIKTVLLTLGPPKTSLYNPSLNRYNMFHLWGIDVLFMKNGTPIILEFNSYPVLNTLTNTLFKLRMRRNIIQGTLNTVGFHLPPTMSEHDKYLVRQALNYNNNNTIVTYDIRLYEVIEPISVLSRTRKRNIYNLNIDEVKQLIHAEDELHRAELNHFIRLYPSHNMDNYVQYSNKGIYYDSLFLAWEAYNKLNNMNRSLGIELLYNYTKSVYDAHK